jgi:hypothetical protein
MRAGQAMCVLVAALTVMAAARAQDSSRMSQDEVKRMESYTHVPPDVKAFAAEYVAAWNAKDPAKLAQLIVPGSRACVTPESKAVYDEIQRTEMRDAVTPGYLLSLMPIDEANLKAMKQQGYFLVKPERELRVDYDYPNTRDGGQLLLYLVHENGRWMSDFLCMTAHAMQDYREGAADRARYKAIAAGIKEPLRSELMAMLRKHQTGEAEERYKAATGCDMKTAMLVVNALDGRMP